MKLPRDAHQMMWDVHGVAGAFSGLILFVAFFAGTITIFHHELELWEKPALRGRHAVQPASIDALTAAFLAEHRPGVSSPREPGKEPFKSRVYAWMPGPSSPVLGIWTAQYQGDELINEHEAVMDAESRGAVPSEDSELSEFLYGLHFQLALPDPWGGYAYWVFGLAAVVGLLVVVAGLLIHLRLLIAQFFQFRPKAGTRTFWTDMHKVLGVLGLPYWLMYMFTGAWFPLAGLVMMLLGPTAFRDQGGDAEKIIYANAELERPPSGRPAAMLGFDALRDRVHAAWPELEIEGFDVQNYGDEHAICRVRGRAGAGFFGEGTLVLDPISGKVLGREDPSDLDFSTRASQTIARLHFADYGGIALRWCYFVLGVGGCLCIVSGTMIWLELRQKRSANRPSPLGTNRWLAPATASVCLGLCAATAVMFLANKLLPIGMDGRPWWEKLAFWSTWAAAGIYGTRRRPNRLLARDLFAVSAALTLLIPVANAVVTGDHLLRSLSRELWAVAGVDIIALTVGLCFVGLTLSLSKRPGGTSPAIRQRLAPAEINERRAHAMASEN